MSIHHVETTSTLSEKTQSRIQQLVQINRDSASGFREAAEAVAEKSLASDFRVWAADRTRQANELATYLQDETEIPEEESWLASLHQTWLKLRAAMSSGDAYAVLAEAERGEDQIKEKYEEVLKDTAGSAVNDILQRQYASVKAVHDRVRDMRDACKKS